MQTRQLGRTGRLVSRLGLGLAALGRPGYINLGHASDLAGSTDPEALRQRTQFVLDAAWGAGVCYFDAARSYGRAEEFLAGWLATRTVPPRQAWIASKWGYTYTAGWQTDAPTHEVKDHSAGQFRRQLTETQALLGSHLDLYQVHSLTPESPLFDDAEGLAELAALKASGVWIGASVSGPRQADTLRRALNVTVDGERLFDVVQATWNLLEPSAGPALAEAHAVGVGVVVKEALANGRLTTRDPGQAAGPLSTAAARLGVTPDAVALAAVLAQPWADVVLSGAATVEQLHSNLTALDVNGDAGWTVELAGLVEEPAAYWQTRGRLAWN